MIDHVDYLIFDFFLIFYVVVDYLLVLPDKNKKINQYKDYFSLNC